MKTLPSLDVSDELCTQIHEVVKISGLSEAEVIRQALWIGLPQLINRAQPPSFWLEERIREALAERVGPETPAEFAKRLQAIAAR